MSFGRIFVGSSTLAAALAFGASRGPDPAPLPPPPAAANCALFGPEAAAATGESCSACHQHRGDGNHPVDVDYQAARGGELRDQLRPAEEVVRRGVFLPNGQVRCTTCHSARSPWKDRIALPPGSVAQPAVDPGDPTTYDPTLRRAVRLTAGSAVTAKPLCLACHALD